MEKSIDSSSLVIKQMARKVRAEIVNETRVSESIFRKK